MSNPQAFQQGDLLVFQIESGYGIIRILAIDEPDDETVWHVAIYRDLFPDVEFADVASADPNELSVEIPHAALSDRAFHNTQVAKLRSHPLNGSETEIVDKWRSDTDREVSERSVRLLLGLR